MTCMLCGGAEFEVIADRLRHDVPRRVMRCRSCELVCLENPGADAVNYAQPEYRKQHGPVLGKESTPAEMFEISLPRQQERVARIRGLLGPEKEVLEVGCSTGHFLHSVRPHVKRAAGIEPNPAHAAFARESIGLEVVDRHLEDSGFATGQFDILFMFQVLEHIADPLPFLAHCRRLLKPGGTLYLEVPNLDDALLSVYALPAYRNFYFRSPHVYYYSGPTLLRLLQRAGFAGRTFSAQAYSLFNHVHWIQNERPQATQAEGCELPRWSSPVSGNQASAKVRSWMADADRGYRELLVQLGKGELLCFEGKAGSTSPL